MDFKKLLAKIDSLEGKKQLNESKEDYEYYFGKDKKSGGAKERDTATGHTAKKTDKGTQYTKKDLPGQDTSKDADTKAAEKRAKKKASEDIADLIRSLNAIVESKDEVEEEKTEEGNAVTGGLADPDVKVGEKIPGTDVVKKKHITTETEDKDEDDDKEDDAEDKKPMKESRYQDLEECYGSMMDGPQEQESGMNINASTDTRTGSKSLTVTAQGQAAEELAQLLKLSGIGTSSTAADEVEVKMEADYVNEPQVSVQGLEPQLQQGNDMHRQKQAHPKVAGGDNPMAMREARELAELEKQLTEALAEFKIAEAKKGSKPDFLDMDKDGDKKEPMKKALADKKAPPKKK